MNPKGFSKLIHFVLWQIKKCERFIWHPSNQRWTEKLERCRCSRTYAPLSGRIRMVNLLLIYRLRSTVRVQEMPQTIKELNLWNFLAANVQPAAVAANHSFLCHSFVAPQPQHWNESLCFVLFFLCQTCAHVCGDVLFPGIASMLKNEYDKEKERKKQQKFAPAVYRWQTTPLKAMPKCTELLPTGAHTQQMQFIFIFIILFSLQVQGVRLAELSPCAECFRCNCNDTPYVIANGNVHCASEYKNRWSEFVKIDTAVYHGITCTRIHITIYQAYGRMNFRMKPTMWASERVWISVSVMCIYFHLEFHSHPVDWAMDSHIDASPRRKNMGIYVWEILLFNYFSFI